MGRPKRRKGPTPPNRRRSASSRMVVGDRWFDAQTLSRNLVDNTIPIEVTLAKGHMTDEEVRRYRAEAAEVLRELASQIEEADLG